MFCYQCEQTAGGTGCTKVGVCGKTAISSDNMDALLNVVIELAKKAKETSTNKEINDYIVDALFTTVTNVNFDEKVVEDMMLKGTKIYEKYFSSSPLDIKNYSIPSLKEKYGEDVAGVLATTLFGLKGAAAYVHHARVLGFESDDIYAEFINILAFIGDDSFTLETLLGKALDTGKLNYMAMELLDKANTETYGHPEPTEVLITPKKGKAILVSGHDLKDIYKLLEQTKDKGINIYTHGEMLPTLAYPKLKAFPHFAGHYGTAWQNQQKEFNSFPGAILMTTNCIMRPQESYKKKIFTTGLVEFPGLIHVSNDDFSPVINEALSEPGFTEDVEPKTITIGFGHNAVMGVAGTVIDLVKQGKIKHFYLIGGCDGAKPGRNYYTNLAESVPQDSVILTLACGKFRFNTLDFGNIEGIPRLLDIGQCNDAYSAIQIALALANAFDCSVNELPLSIILSWYEQKAVAVLLTLLSLGIQNIKIGPSLPAFITPSVLQVLQDKFNIAPISTPELDIVK